MRKSKGDYFSFLDVDDEIMPNKFEIQLNTFNQYPNAFMVVGQTLKVYTDGRNYNPNENKLSLGLNSSPRIGFGLNNCIIHILLVLIKRHNSGKNRFS